MVPMLTCGLVRSNFAFATGVLLRTCCVTPYGQAGRGDVWGGDARRGVYPASLASGFLDDLLRDVPGNLGVGVELHRVHRTTLGLGPQVANVSEHLRQRDKGADDLGTADVLHGLDLATAGVEVADVVLGRTHLDGHHRLEEHGVGLADGLLQHHRTGDLERHLRGVDVVVGAIEQGGLDADQRVAGEHTELHGVLDAVVHGGDVLTQDTATGDLVLELVELALGGVQRREGHLHLGVLTRATGLLLVDVVDLVHGAADGLAVGHLGLAAVGLDLELAAHAVHQDVQVELAHAGDDRLAGLLVQADLERRVLLGELLDGRAELLLVTLGLGLDGHGDHGLGEGHGLQDDLLLRVAQGVTGRGVLQADHRVDVAGGRVLDRVLLVGVHLEELADALLLALGRVDDRGAGGDLARVDADVGETTEERVAHDLERQGRERLVGGRGAGDDLLLVAHGVTLHRGHVQRGRQEVDDGVEHGLDALVLERGATEDRVDLAGDRHLADGGLELGDGQLLATEVLLEQRLVGLGDLLDQLVAVLLGLLLEVGRDVLDRVVLTLGGLAAPGEGLHREQVDDADEVGLGADGQLQDQRSRTEALDDGLDGEVEVRTELVHLVDEADARDVVLVRLTPHRLGLGLDTLLAVEDGDSAVEDAQGPLDLDREVDVTGRVDDVDLVVLPEGRRRGRRDRDAALLLLLHPVHRGSAIVDLTDLVRDACVEQDPLGRRRLAGIDVGHDADVADLGQVRKDVECHGFLSRLVSRDVSGAVGPGYGYRPRVSFPGCSGEQPGKGAVYQR